MRHDHRREALAAILRTEIYGELDNMLRKSIERNEELAKQSRDDLAFGFRQGKVVCAWSLREWIKQKLRE